MLQHAVQCCQNVQQHAVASFIACCSMLQHGNGHLHTLAFMVQAHSQHSVYPFQEGRLARKYQHQPATCYLCSLALSLHFQEKTQLIKTGFSGSRWLAWISDDQDIISDAQACKRLLLYEQSRSLRSLFRQFLGSDKSTCIKDIARVIRNLQ